MLLRGEWEQVRVIFGWIGVGGHFFMSKWGWVVVEGGIFWVGEGVFTFIMRSWGWVEVYFR